MRGSVRSLIACLLAVEAFAVGGLARVLAGDKAASPLSVEQEKRETHHAVPERPQSPTAAKAYASLEQHCARCHQTGATQGRPPAAGFGNVLDLERMAREPHLVRPGNPDASPLYTSMLARTMPYDVYHDGRGEPPSAVQVEAVRDWIEALPPDSGCPERKPITAHATIARVQRTIDETPEPQRRLVRFVSLEHLYNACVDERRLAGYVHGVGKLLNSLSWALDPARIEPVDPEGALLKVDIAALGWTADNWEHLTTAYPYAALDSAGVAGAISTSTRAPITVVRGDWLAFAASRAPLYYQLLGIPDSSRALLSSLRIDLEAGNAARTTRRFGVRGSSVARGTRLIERLAFANGAFWRTHEYAAGGSRPDPLDQVMASPARPPPKAGAGLGMFSLPNGFVAFLMTVDDGQRANDLPHSILVDPARPSGRVTAATSCFGCHRQGPVAHLDGDATLAQLAATDGQSLRQSMTAAGLDPDLTLDGVDPVVALADQYVRNITLRGAAAELGMSPSAFAALADKAEGEELRLVQRLVLGSATRHEFERRFASLRALVHDGDVGRTVYDAPPAALGSGPRPDTADLLLVTSRPKYRAGDPLTIIARAASGCHLTLINVDRSGRGTVVFPNEFEQSNFLAPGRELQVPSANAPYQFRVRDPGRETIIGVCTQGTKTADGIVHDFEKQRFTVLGDYRAFIARAYAAETEARRGQEKLTDTRARAGEARVKRARKGRGKAEPAPAGPAAAGEDQARTAIQIEVRAN